MTPDQARRLLDGTTPGPWLSDLDRNSDEPSGIYAAVAQGGGFSARLVAEEICEEADAALIATAPTLASMIAGMRTEYAIAYLGRDGTLALIDEGYETLDAAQRRRDQLLAIVRPHTKIMRRAVGEWEEA